MEPYPLSADTDPEKKSETKESRKRKDQAAAEKARRLGKSLVESGPQRSHTQEQRERRPFKLFEKEVKPKNEEPEEPPEALAGKTAEEAPETEPASEAEAPTEEIGEAETAKVEAQLVAVLEELDNGRPAEPETDPFIEYFRREVEAERGSEVAFEEVMAQLGIEPEALAEAAEPEPELEPAGDSFEEELVIDHSTARAEAEPEEEDLATAGAGTGGGTGAPSPPTQQGGPGGTGAGGQPPRGRQPFGTPAFGGFNPNQTPPLRAAAPNRQPYQPEYRQASPAAMALFGGIIGYLIGRRRGRIRTEKKLLPIQKKLEAQVEDMQWQLQAKERRIRQVAAEKVQQQGPAIVETIKQKIAERPGRLETVRVERRRAPEAHQLHGETPKTTGLLGHVVVAEAIPAARRTEAKPASKAEKSQPKVEIPAGKRIETLSRAELLALSEKIEVEGSTLRQIYETHLVGERGLRRLVGEYLRGGDVKKILRQEIIEHEIDFERDPAMRDMAPAVSGSAAPGGNPTLNKLIETAVEKVPGHQEANFIRQQAAAEAAQAQQQKQHRRLIDVSLATVIAVLVALVVYLLLNRG